MRATGTHRYLLTRWLWLLAWVTVTLGSAGSATAQDEQKRVLVVYSSRRDTQLTTLAERELPRLLSEGLGEPIDYYAEYIDLARFPDKRYQTSFREFMLSRYREQQLDLVIALQDTALEFVVQNRSLLFPDAPIVFIATSGSLRVSNSTGLVALAEFGQTLTLAMALQPDINHVSVVVGNSAPDKVLESQARSQFRGFEDRLSFSYLSGLTADEVERRVAMLPDRSLVFYLLFYQDGAGENFHPLDYLDRVALVANAPIYSWVDSTMGHGIVGGSLLQQEARIARLADLALRVLRGEPADSIPISSPNLNVPQLDWRQLRRWGISEARIPVRTVILFREPAVWDRYKFYILAGVTLLLAQTVLIAGLLVQRARRREAEERVQQGQAELRASYDRIRDLGGRLLTAQEAERSHIARELHDDISQQVALLSIDLHLLGTFSRDEASAGLIGEASDRAQGIAKSLHDLSHRLHPTKLQLVGLVAALSGLQRELTRPDVSISFSHENVPAGLPPALTLSLFRIAQEAAQNAATHSGAQNVWLHVSGGEHGVSLTVVDDGKGFDVDGAWGKGLGLISMRERLEPFGGTLTIRSETGTGTRLEAAVPFSADSAQVS
jgi:signal transduction histidine kinase